MGSYLRLAALTAALMLVSASASAGTITFVTPAGTKLDGLPVVAVATFTTMSGELIIGLDNEQTNPTNIIQLLDDIQFTLTGNDLGSATLSDSSAVPVTVNGDGTFSTGAPTQTGWQVTSSGSTFHLFAPGTALIIGGSDAGSFTSGSFTNADTTIAGSANNPFLAGGASFTLTIPNVTPTTTVSTAAFSFGLPVPEPATLALFGIGLAGMRFSRRRPRSTH